MEQTIRFCRARDGVRLAYGISGAGPALLKSAHWLTHLDHDWSSPIWRHHHLGLSRRYRFVRYDQRGSGLSDHDAAEMSLAAWVADLEAVVESAGLERFVLLGMSQGGPIAVEYAARHPDRVSHLVLYGSYARGRRHWDLTGEETRESDAMVELMRLGWERENPAFRQLFSSLFMPGAEPDLVNHFNELQRKSTSAENAARIVSVMDRLDVSATANDLEVPTLVMHCENDARIPFTEGRRLAAEIPGAQFVPLPGGNHIMLESDPAWPRFLDELAAFTGFGEVGDSMDTELIVDLTPRERAVLDLLATGMGNAEIAERLHLAPKTVRNYMTRLLDKLGVASRGEAIVAARNAGLGMPRRQP